MKTTVLRVPLVYILLLSANLLAFLESRVVDVTLKIFPLAIFVSAILLNKSVLYEIYSQSRSDVKILIWYKTLPPDYFVKLDQESQAIFFRYQESLKPKPPLGKVISNFPNISARSYVVLDRPSNTVLSSKDEQSVYPPASTAKLATALAALKLYKLDEEVAVPQFCTQVEGTKAEFMQGQKFLVGDLLKALLVHSSGDAGCVLSIGKVSYADFIKLMNEIAKESGLVNSKFTNPIGLDDADGENLASAQDLAKLGAFAVQNDFIKEVVKLKDFELRDVNGKYSKKLANTNKLLLEIPETVGIKTGTTSGAGEVLIYEYQKDKTDLIIVVMGSSDRFTDTKNILMWTLESFTWE